jgi:hypothetical protein
VKCCLELLIGSRLQMVGNHVGLSLKSKVAFLCAPLFEREPIKHDNDSQDSGVEK